MKSNCFLCYMFMSYSSGTSLNRRCNLVSIANENYEFVYIGSVLKYLSYGFLEAISSIVVLSFMQAEVL